MAIIFYAFCVFFMKKIIFIFIIGIVMLGFCELAFRIAGFYPALPLDREKPGVQAYYWVCDKNLGWRNRADGSYDYDMMAANPHSTTDANGFRNGYGWHDGITNPLVLFIGDSFVFGAEVNDEQTICSEVTKLLKPETGMVVLNTGVRGYNTVQSRRMMHECFGRYSNIVAVVYVYCGNDVQENVNMNAYKPAKTPIAVLSDKGKLSEVDVTEPAVPWGNDFIALMEKDLQHKKEQWQKKRWDRKLRDRIREHSAFINTINNAISNCKDRPACLPESAHSPATNKNNGDETSCATNDYARDVLIALLKEMNSDCNVRGIPFVVTTAVTRNNLQGIDKWSKDAGVDFVDVSGGFTGNQFYYMSRRRDRVYDPHYNALGTKTFAKAFVPQFEKIIATKKHKIHKKKTAHEFHE